jgi:hypothetical protein
MPNETMQHDEPDDHEHRPKIPENQWQRLVTPPENQQIQPGHQPPQAALQYVPQ